MALVERVQLQHLYNPEGSIVVAQTGKEVPFNIKRVYCLYGVPLEQYRGRHAHKSLTQVAFCAAGSCRFILDDGHEQCGITLSSPYEGILIRPRIWREMTNFTSDCVLVVLASEHYDEADYIRDYADFKRFVGG